MAADWRRWHLNAFGLEMHLIMATGNKFEQSKATVVPIGLSADGGELAQMAFKCVLAGNAPDYGNWE